MRPVVVFLAISFLAGAFLLAGGRTPALAGDEPESAAPAKPDERIAGLVEQLGSDDFRVRERASKELADLGAAAKPALEAALAKSDSLEVRWRAEQLLRRLDRQGEQPLLDEPLKPDAPIEDSDVVEDDLDDGFPGAPPADMESLRRYLEKRFRGLMPQGHGRAVDPFSFAFGRIEAGDLTLERGAFGGVVLHVRQEGGAAEEVYRGRTLDEILERSPALREHPAMEELRKKVEQDPRSFVPGITLHPAVRGGMTFSTSSGVEIVSNSRGTKVKIREVGEDGKETVKEYEGKDLDEIKAKHPEIADKLGNITFRMQITPWPTPRVYGPPRRRAAPPALSPSDEDAAAESEDAPFGIAVVSPIEDPLAVHLGVDKDAALMVSSVRPGSPAAAIGLELHDVIVAVDGMPVTDAEEAIGVLRSAGRDPKRPLTLEVIRAGKRQTLTR